MKTSTFLCTAIAATMGFSSLASAQVYRDGPRQERREDRRERIEDARERVEDRREVREDRRERREDFAERREDRAERREDFRDGQQRWVHPRAYHPAPNYQHAPNYYNHGYNQGYSRGYAPSYYANTAPRFYRGGYLPRDYRHSSYFVANWNAYPALYAPPYGHQWVQIGNDFLLVAVTTGLIAHLLTM